MIQDPTNSVSNGADVETRPVINILHSWAAWLTVTLGKCHMLLASGCPPAVMGKNC